MIGIETIITPQVRKELTPESYDTAFRMMWETIGRKVDKKAILHLFLIACNEKEAEKVKALI